MTGDEFRKLWKTEPFRPFRMRLTSGRSIDVFRPSLAGLSPGGRTAAVFPPDSDGSAIVDLETVEEVGYLHEDPEDEDQGRLF